MPTANERYFDAQLRHAVGVQRYTAGQIKRILAVLEELDAETVRTLRRRLGRVIRGRRALESAVLATLLEDVVLLRKEGILGVFGEAKKEWREFAKTQVDFEGRMVLASVPIEVNLAAVDVRKVAAVVSSKPFQGALLREWVSGFVRADRERLERTIKMGVAEGRSVDEIVRGVVGTRAAGYSDGILSVSRNQANTLVRTTVNHVANSSRQLFYDENEDYFVALRWEATLDSRTSSICRARDGALSPVGSSALPSGSRALDPPDARPPAHFNCRSTMVAVLDGDAEIFAGLDRQSEIGPVPQETTYGPWLRRQPKEFQEQVLGKKKAALFRKGELPIEKFVDRRGNELTLAQLQQTYPEAYAKAGI